MNKKTLRTATKTRFNLLDYTIWGVLANKTNATSYPNIGSLKTSIEEEWNKMSEEYIMKACKSFQRWVNTITKKNNKKTKNKNGDHIENINCFVSIFLFC